MSAIGTCRRINDDTGGEPPFVERVRRSCGDTDRFGEHLAAWIAAHVILVALTVGVLAGYVLGRRVVLDAVREIVAERARDIGRLPL